VDWEMLALDLPDIQIAIAAKLSHGLEPNDECTLT
jgi:hypothetical protein